LQRAAARAELRQAILLARASGETYAALPSRELSRRTDSGWEMLNKDGYLGFVSDEGDITRTSTGRLRDGRA
jgi:hypothetical protein